MNLKFWEKDKDPFDLPPKEDNMDFSAHMPPEVNQLQAPPDFNPQSTLPQGMALTPSQPQQQNNDNVQQQLIIAKLDTIASKIDTLTHRIENIEKKSMNDSNTPKQPGPWYR